ncbi:MAG: decarboxylating NADP(+)-dependent phosphogluconate dehydrogenase [Acidimicrobiia bacterium]|nr:decarboxylating NADP(+)-dependent phosphogluconate dehydrogenase [Acidimicrobiia bacterium]
MTEQMADIGVIGLAVMGQNLVLNLSDHGHAVAVFNRTTARTKEFLAGPAMGRNIVGAHDLPGFVALLKKPRRVLLMIKAGPSVDMQIENLVPFLEPGDIIIDGGNSLYTDTERRWVELAQHGIHFVGVGISGGEDGARNGPSIMPGGEPAAWPIIKPMVTSIAADYHGEPCADWIGSGGAGHYVKMVHNGIEYGDMQVIAEAYDVMSRGLGMSASEIRPHFSAWNKGKLDSYLIEITADILGHTTNGIPTVDLILDAAGQKGTGKWTVIASMDEGMPVSLVAESVYARMVSALHAERQRAAEMLGGSVSLIVDDPVEVIDDLHDALYGSKIVSYAQGFMLFRAASEHFHWDLKPDVIASLWRAGCIIRSQFLGDITAAYRSNPDLENLLIDDYFASEITATLPGWRRTVARAAMSGIPVPAYAAALAFFDSYRARRLPANLIQAQRDYFGAHTYERVDRDRGEWFHTDWTGHGGDVTSGTYEA